MREVLTLERLRDMELDAAAALLAYRRADGAGDLDEGVLAEWVALSPAHAAAWDDAQDAWTDFDGSEDDEILTALRADARRAGPERPRWAMPAAAIAAAAIVVVAVGGGFGSGLFPRGGEAGAPVTASQAPAEGQSFAAVEAVRTFNLADGTRMSLAPDSAAVVTLADSRRDVRLDRGRAFFAVAHDARRAFAVRAGSQEIVALGTQFDVRLQPGELRVTLLEGRVSVGPVTSKKVTYLQPGQVLVAQAGVAPTVGTADLDETARWRETFIEFDNVTLAEAAATINKQGGDQLIVRDPKVAALRISGRFRPGDMARFGRSVEMLHRVRLAPAGPGRWEIVAAR